MMRLAFAAALAFAATPALAMELTSPDVSDGKPIETKFACAKYGGAAVSPALAWSGVPAGTKSLAVTMFDPDAGTKGFWHWLAVDIPPSVTGLAQGAGAPGALPAGATPVPNGAGQPSYAGPCPPAGPAHHYQITLYALPDARAAIAGMKAPDAGAWLAKAAIATARITPVYGH